LGFRGPMRPKVGRSRKSALATCSGFALQGPARAICAGC
jgi:hypothetical protein